MSVAGCILQRIIIESSYANHCPINETYTVPLSSFLGMHGCSINMCNTREKVCVAIASKDVRVCIEDKLRCLPDGTENDGSRTDSESRLAISI